MAALKKLEVAIDKAELMALATANPADPAIATLAARMTANGGEKEVDALVNSPKTTDPQMIAALATGRFGVTMVPDTSAAAVAAKEEAKNMKALYKTFLMVPKDVKAFGSITRITHTDSTGGSGAWGPDGAVTLSGRPDEHKQELGPKMTAPDPTDPSGKKKVKQLPADVDKDCLPVGGDGEYTSFTALHEVAHGIDDSKTYMLRNRGREDHGGWIELRLRRAGHRRRGGPAHPHQGGRRQHLLLEGRGQEVRPRRAAQPEADPPRARWWPAPTTRRPTTSSIAGTASPPPTGSGSAREMPSRSPSATRRSTTSPTARVGELPPRGAQEGLTGYQFRAPGEWFAELYAGFKSKKLGAKHPANDWLKKL